MMDMFVTRQEERWMKIDPNTTTTFRREPSSDGLESYVMQDEERQVKYSDSTRASREEEKKIGDC